MGQGRQQGEERSQYLVGGEGEVVGGKGEHTASEEASRGCGIMEGSQGWERSSGTKLRAAGVLL